MKPVTVQKVSAVLRKAGLTRNESYPLTPGSDARLNTGGYRVEVWAEVPAVAVSYVSNNENAPRKYDPSIRANAITAYRAALESADIVVEQQGDTLICRGIKEEG